MPVATLLVSACREADVDVATGQCAAVMWVPQSSILPELTIEGAQLMGACILGLWAVAYVFRLLRKSIK
ncbi:hypothetical protein FUT69_06940 [Xylella taiwanensis]|uniref:Membrane protein n=1 Tax=Xylella taiwanensis TaxID=1444770 RepID=Z9JG51_9GAMM|nr:hypothetical protein [Xylella taiwanensis]AXI83573.1 membrane protein [Xylella taiwanensis]AXI83585.1 membrane protein [Xylella taiwanensis]EWS76988.1 membrane protein [Xylella taiwanensis]MCD8456650.1 hypothetical protein [Xylella taiwanensis]MCD8456665.1 hypothetical protein [Xylella taiwanensis]